jgi:pimeloyl-ACP methyl ester carboxylesterase
MDYIATRGYDVYLLDLRGLRKSTRPPEMDDKPEANAPVVRGVTAVKDISAVVDFILKRRGIPRLNLLGWSWGDHADGDLHHGRIQAKSSGSCSTRRPGFERRHRCHGRPARSAPIVRCARAGEEPVADRRARGQEGGP